MDSLSVTLLVILVSKDNTCDSGKLKTDGVTKAAFGRLLTHTQTTCLGLLVTEMSKHQESNTGSVVSQVNIYI